MTTRTTLARWLPRILGFALLCITIVLALWLRNFVGEKPVEQKKVIQQITVVAPPPPPPPPPPQQEPEPEVVEQDIEQPMDEALPDAPMDDAGGSELGMDADGSAGGDGFGLVARKGGKGLLGGGSPYAVEVQGVITDVLSANDSLRHMSYVAVLKLWIDESGKLKRYEIQQREGNPDVQKLLQTALASVDRFDNPPPLEMPQPIKLRIKSQL